MAIAFRAAATGTSTFPGASVTIPATVEAGDLLIVVTDVNSRVYTAQTPEGWELLDSSADSEDGGSQFASLYWRRAAGIDAGTVVLFPVTPTGSTKAASLAAYYSDVPGNLIVTSVTAVRPETVDGTTHATPVVDVADLPAWQVTAVGKKGSTVSSLAPPSGYTLRGTPCYTLGASNNGTAIADKAAAATGSTDGGSWTANVSNGAASTFVTTLVEAAPAAAPPISLRRWNGAAWDLVGES
jgi:hypothetical protein